MNIEYYGDLSVLRQSFWPTTLSYLYSMPAIEYPALEHALIQDSIVIAASLLMLLTKILPCALSTQQPLYDQP